MVPRIHFIMLCHPGIERPLQPISRGAWLLTISPESRPCLRTDGKDLTGMWNARVIGARSLPQNFKDMFDRLGKEALSIQYMELWEWQIFSGDPKHLELLETWNIYCGQLSLSMASDQDKRHIGRTNKAVPVRTHRPNGTPISPLYVLDTGHGATEFNFCSTRFQSCSDLMFSQTHSSLLEWECFACVTAPWGYAAWRLYFRKILRI